ncbi:sulfatase-like hydrolase/transferase [Nocardioides campestrisoli]|uniref:sulfatase-like hydrolase/transferase n=1 Tax=Nocardioides campestrisoli TaxID=2736757 RepID=UPI00163D7D14|nr:sulfatase-like hydrolase/transferase [Nocardioides campestrisoli]
MDGSGGVGARARAVGTLLAAWALLCGCTAAVGEETTPRPVPRESAPQVQRDRPGQTPQPDLAGSRPDIVMVLMDDFSMDLLPTMRSARRMSRTGAGYDHFVVDSLCCVSRASLMTGQYPHQTGVRTNTSEGLLPYGGYPAFARYGNGPRSVNVRLQQTGYTTAFVGKYLNEFEYVPGVRDAPPVPPGWSQFHVLFGSAYDGWGFDSTALVDGALRVRSHPAPPAGSPTAVLDAAYAGQVVEDYALDFIAGQRGSADPYFLQVAPYAPHNRVNPEGAYPGDPVFPAAFRDRPGGRKAGGDCGRVACSSLTVKDLPGFGDNRRDNVPRTRAGKRARAWNTMRPLAAGGATARLRDRARMVQSIDRTVSRILRAVDEDTLVVLTSDNGFHLGQLGLGMGKGTAYDTDVRVPLLVTGPGVAPGQRQGLTSNLDLAPTFEELAGLTPAPYRSGRSLVPSLADRTAPTGDHVFFEHTTGTAGGDPDRAFTGGELMRIPSFVAVRSREALLVRSDLDPSPDSVRHGYELYPYDKHPWEKKNKYGVRKYAGLQRDLMRRLRDFDRCTGVTGDAPVPARCRRLTGTPTS